MKKLSNYCLICNTKTRFFSKYIGICPICVRNYPDKAIEISKNSISRARDIWNLPQEVPKEEEGSECPLCSNKCSIGLGNRGYCGLRENINGKIKPILGKKLALLHTYLDPLPTNCCSTYFCPGGTTSGYPQYSYSEGIEYGYYNLACFLYGCNFFCLGCQNDQHRHIETAESYSIEKFVEKVRKNTRVSCICWFGGSPEPQLPWALKTSRATIKSVNNRILRICWEWNGAGNPKLVQNAVKISLETGGNAKFDLKYFNPVISQLFSGVSNEQPFINFRKCFDLFYHKREDPVLTASTLLIPGYVDQEEVEGIAKFLAELDNEIPYSLLIFYPTSFLSDMTITSVEQVRNCYSTAKKYLKNVHLGNKHLLGLKLIRNKIP